MEKHEFRAVIKHFYLKGNIPKEVKDELNKVRGRSVNEFKRVRTATNDEPRSGRPVEAFFSKINNKIHDIVLSEVLEQVETTGVSHFQFFTTN